MFTSIGPLELLVLILAVPLILVIVGIIVRRRACNRSASSFDVPTLIRQGWRIETETDELVVLVTGRRVNHILHLLLTLITVGIWVLVWIILVVTGGEKRKVINKPGSEARATLHQDR